MNTKKVCVDKWMEVRYLDITGGSGSTRMHLSRLEGWLDERANTCMVIGLRDLDRPLTMGGSITFHIRPLERLSDLDDVERAMDNKEPK